MAKHEENEWDVHIVKNLLILKLHYCLHDWMFQTTFLQSSQGLKLKMRSPFFFLNVKVISEDSNKSSQSTNAS